MSIDDRNMVAVRLRGAPADGQQRRERKNDAKRPMKNGALTFSIARE
ncbi:hypothetical protein U91I_02623 [alpha proteobacterium U9-1i]|nr:hypothetical protein U91I_02623 [alpha proteobacterium U9-1i]